MVLWREDKITHYNRYVTHTNTYNDGTYREKDPPIVKLETHYSNYKEIRRIIIERKLSLKLVAKCSQIEF